MPYDSIFLNKGVDKKIKAGIPWIFIDEINSSAKLPLLSAGQLVNIVDSKGVYVATAYFDPLAKIAFRILTYTSNEKIDQKFFNEKIEFANERRNYLPENYYRLFYSEADGIPGLIIDRYGDLFYIKLGSRGLNKYLDLIVNSLSTFKPMGIFLSKIDGTEIIGNIPSTIEITENNTIYFCSLIEGQKTGWYFDQRENHQMIAELAEGKRVLDIFSYNGGFGVICGKYGASEVTFIDSSEKAIGFCQQAIIANTITSKVSYIREDALEALDELARRNKQFDVITIDPPPYIKKKKDKVAGIKGYWRLLEEVLPLLAENGIVFFSTCSHYMHLSDLLNLVHKFAVSKKLKIEILRKSGQAKDHPIHPQLSKTRYLNGVLFRFL